MISSIICAGNLHGGVVSAEIIHHRAGVVVLVFILFEVVLKCVFFIIICIVNGKGKISLA